MEVPVLKKEHGSEHEGLNFTFKVLTAFLLPLENTQS